MKIYGPYKNRQNRLHICIVEDDGTKRSMSYPKWIYEQHINRKLTGNETIDHIDGNTLNNDISNLQILSRADNARKSIKPSPKINLVCKICSKEFIRKLRDEKRRQKDKKDGPFCSHRCVGEIHH